MIQKIVPCIFFLIFIFCLNTAFAKIVTVLYDSAMTLMEQKKFKDAIPILAHIVLNEPEFRDSYPIFSNLCFYYKKHDLLIETNQKLIPRDSQKGKYFLDLAQAYFREEKLTQADAVLTDSTFLYSTHSQTLKKLLLAKICFAREEDWTGQDEYFQAITAIKSGTDVAAIFQDLIYLVDDAEFARYDSTALPDKAQFFRTFWRRRDPTPLTDFNERIPEHFRRLFYARKEYRKFITNRIQSKPSPLDIKTPGNFNPYKKPKLPRGFLEQKDIDDQGCIYIRHGKPDDSEKQLFEIIWPDDPFIVPEEFAEYVFDTWQYLASGNRPEVLYFFYSSGKGFHILSAPLKTDNLEMFDPRFYNADSWRYLELVDENFKAIEEHVTLETTDYKYSPKTFEFPYTLVSFKDSQLNSLELYFGVPLKEFKPDKNETELPLQIEKGFALFDANWEVIDQWNESNQYETRFKNDAWKEILYLNGRKYHLPAGEYHFALQLDDPVSGKMALYRGDCFLPNYFADSLQLSKIILAKNLQPQTPQSLFAKDGVQFTPKFNGLFKLQEPVALYYEIYNLNYNSKGQTKYEITYSVWPYSKEAEIENPRKKKPIIRTGTRQNGDKRDEKVWMSFYFSEQKKGKYVIEILVKDQVGGAEVRKLVPVEVE